MGNNFVIPVDPRQKHPVISSKKTIKGLIALSELPGEKLGYDRWVDGRPRSRGISVQRSWLSPLIIFCPAPHTYRAVNLPSISATLDDLRFHTEQIAAARGIPLGEVTKKIDPLISRVVNSMPQIMHSPRAKSLGLPRDRGVEDIVEAYINEFLDDEINEQGYTLLSVHWDGGRRTCS